MNAAIVLTFGRPFRLTLPNWTLCRCFKFSGSAADGRSHAGVDPRDLLGIVTFGFP
jgi:hypothetical protein